MNIFIYGKDEFKKDIRKILSDSKIDQILENVTIMQISDLDDLKEQIASNPDDVFLIDDDKILKKSKFGFIKPKDAIEEEFLLQCGVSELSIDSFSEIPDYIIRKHKRLNPVQKEQEIIETINDENSEDIVQNEETIIEDANTISNPDDILVDLDSEKNSDFDEDFGLNNIDLDYDAFESVQENENKEQEKELNLEENELDSEATTTSPDDLNSFISDDFDIEDFKFDESEFDFKDLKTEDFDLLIEEEIKEEENEQKSEDFDFDSLENKEEIVLKPDNESLDENFDNSELENLEDFNFIDENSNDIENIEPELPYLGDIEKSIEKSLEEEKSIEDNLENNNEIQKEETDMSEFLNLDDINEDDMLNALGLESEFKEEIEDKIDENIISDEIIDEKENNNSNSIELNASNIEDVTALLTKLLKNKNVELSIKIKE